MTHERTTSAGFTLIEVAVVCAIIGVLALLAYPNMVRFQAQQNTKAGATRMAGVLGEARSRATNEATPYLVYFNEKTVDGDGNCGPAATMVRDSDRTYSITEGDDVREVELDPAACKDTKPFGDPGSTVDASIRVPKEDLAVRTLGETVSGVVGTVAGGVGGIVSGLVGGTNEPTTAAETKTLAETVVNGATFPIDADSGRPVVAFSERGIPVDPANPTSWGSGAGALYITDGRSTVYAAMVQPLGTVQLRVFDRVSGEWR